MKMKGQSNWLQRWEVKGNVLLYSTLHNICDALVQSGNCLSKNIRGIKGNVFEWAAGNDCMPLIATTQPVLYLLFVMDWEFFLFIFYIKLVIQSCQKCSIFFFIPLKHILHSLVQFMLQGLFSCAVKYSTHIFQLLVS